MIVVEQMAHEAAAANPHNPFNKFLVDLANYLREHCPEQTFEGTRRALVVEVLVHKRCYTNSLTNKLHGGLMYALDYRAGHIDLEVLERDVVNDEPTLKIRACSTAAG